MRSYPFAEIEAKWQRFWEESGEYHAQDACDKPKCYMLVEFPYPSGSGLHVGHPRSYTALDVVARKRRMEGYNVLYPIGFDAFGLPAENYAIETGTHPRDTTKKNIAEYRRQLKSLGLSFDWSREVNTTDPGYYKWTQWMFLRMFKAGLAYKAEMPINWCPAMGTVLANEEVIDGKSERGGHPVVRVLKSQWMLRITKYADRLIEDLKTVDFIRPVVDQQTNWIGRSEGAVIFFPLENVAQRLEVFTTRPDTIFGATYMVVAPEHPLIDKFQGQIENWAEVAEYRARAAGKSDLDRTDLAKEKTGVELKGLRAVNPASQTSIPVWTSDYVLMSYGTAAIMAVPGHDTRDWEFARKFGLPIVEVVQGGDVEQAAFTACDKGTMVNSAFLNGLQVSEAVEKTIEWLESEGRGRREVQYRLRDWVFSRQRYWGEPIPLIHCEKCGWVAVPESELPVLLPDVQEFRPGDDGESPLARHSDWVAAPCPQCGGQGRRETDTMPQWAGSCWYFLRYTDPDNDAAFASTKALDYWMPVDWYNGGMEHTTLHLLYSRFWCKFLYDEGLLPCAEPFRRRTSHGMILGEDGEKMSKSRGNVVNPDDVVARYGADTFRIFEMYVGAFDQATAWSEEGVNGCHRFLNRVWALRAKVTRSTGCPADAVVDDDSLRLMHRTILAVSQRIERMKFNTAVAALMEFSNALQPMQAVPAELFQCLCLLLYPFAPHVAEELWEGLGNTLPISRRQWPVADPELAKPKRLTIAIQVNGKLRDTMEVEEDATEEEITQMAGQRPKVLSHTGGKTPRRTVYVPGRLVNLIV